MNNHVPGVFPPEHLIDERQKVPKDTQIDKGMEIARRMICQLERDAICDGVPIVAIGKEEPVPSVLTTPGIAWSQRYPTALLFDS